MAEDETGHCSVGLRRNRQMAGEPFTTALETAFHDVGSGPRLTVTARHTRPRKRVSTITCLGKSVRTKTEPGFRGDDLIYYRFVLPFIKVVHQLGALVTKKASVFEANRTFHQSHASETSPNREDCQITSSGGATGPTAPIASKYFRWASTTSTTSTSSRIWISNSPAIPRRCAISASSETITLESLS